MKKNFLIIAVLGVVLIAVGSTMILKKLNFQSKAELTEGTVIDMNQKRGRKGPIYSPVISFFSTDGKEHTYRSNYYSKNSPYSVGDKVQIYYNPANPDDAQIGDITRLPIVFMCAGGGFLLYLLIVLILAKLKKKAGMLMMQNGKKITSDIVYVGYDSLLAIMGKRPTVIKSQWVHPQNSTVYIFKSNKLWFDPTPFLSGRKQIDVFIDPENPNKYYMDLSFLPKK